MTDICTQAAREVLGQNRVVTNRQPGLGAEDFADYLNSVPGCMMFIGVKFPGKKITPLHTSTFNLDEKVLLLGVRIFAQILLTWPTGNEPASRR
jgi:metal-dependent amidase/aminoacylase/carboxypeptidase family protein